MHIVDIVGGLQAALARGYNKTVQLLLEKEADMNAEDDRYGMLLLINLD